MRLSTRELSFAAVMAALANVLAMVSIGLTRVGQIGLDFSNLAIFIGGIYGGPVLGFVIGLLGGIVPGLMFGPLGGLGWLGLFGLTFGKSLTGLTVEYVTRTLRVNRKTGVRSMASVLISYLPESFFTILLSEFSSILLGVNSVAKFWLGNFRYCKGLVRDCDYRYLHRSTHA